MNINELVKQLNIANKEIKDLEGYLARKRAEYEQSVSEQTDKVISKKRFVGVYKHIKYTASLGEIQDAIAKVLNLPADRIKIKLKTNEIADYNKFIDIKKGMIDKPAAWLFYDMEAEIMLPNGEQFDLKNLIMIDNVQADGRSLEEHMYTNYRKGNRKNGDIYIYYSSIQFDDYKNIVFDIPFNKLINGNSEESSLNVLGQALSLIEKEREYPQSENSL